MLVEIMVPIILFIVTGATIITALYFRSREREMILQKDYTAEELQALLNPQATRKGGIVVVGILAISFGTGLTIGFIIRDLTGNGDFVSMPLFICVGIGLVISFYVREKLNKKRED